VGRGEREKRDQVIGCFRTFLERKGNQGGKGERKEIRAPVLKSKKGRKKGGGGGEGEREPFVFPITRGVYGRKGDWKEKVLDPYRGVPMEENNTTFKYISHLNKIWGTDIKRRKEKEPPIFYSRRGGKGNIDVVRIKLPI